MHGDDVVILNSPRRGATVDADLVDDDGGAALVARAAAAGVTARVDHADHGPTSWRPSRRSSRRPAPG